MRSATILASGLALWLTGPARAEDPMAVTTDTPAYCLSLARRMEQAGDMPPTVRALWAEGRDMCQRGHIRSGLAHLRRAMMITHGQGE